MSVDPLAQRGAPVPRSPRTGSSPRPRRYPAYRAEPSVEPTFFSRFEWRDGYGQDPTNYLGDSVGSDLTRYRETDQAWWQAQHKVVDDWSGEGLHPARALEVIGNTFGNDAVYVTDGGNTSLWAHWFLPATQPRSYLNILELGMLDEAFGVGAGEDADCRHDPFVRAVPHRGLERSEVHRFPVALRR